MKLPFTTRGLLLSAAALIVPIALYVIISESQKVSVPLKATVRTDNSPHKESPEPIRAAMPQEILGEQDGQPWLSIKGWDLLPPRQKLERLLDAPFGIKENGVISVIEVARDELFVPFQDDPRNSLKKITSQSTVAGLLDEADRLTSRSGQTARLVFYAEGVPHDAAHRRVLSDDVLLRASAEQAEAITAAAKAQGLEVSSPNGNIVATDRRFPGSALLALASLGSKAGVTLAEPMLTMNLAKYAVPNDTLFSQQWYLKNTHQVTPSVAGMDINATTAWDLYTGVGVKICFIDDGMETTHPDLAPNYSAACSRDYVGGDLFPDPAIYDSKLGDLNENHGTAVVGLGVAKGNNGQGISGAAPGATWSGVRLLGTDQPATMIAHAMGWYNDQLHIKSCSWGPPDTIPNATFAMPQIVRDALLDGVTNGRGGLGMIYMFAAGNGRAIGMQGNKNGYANSIYVTAVSAVNASGAIAPYSQYGAHIITCAPSTGSTADPKTVTTDRPGIPGYNSSGTGDLADTSYTNNAFTGTSAATPLATGVVAMMLEANPNLTWRDVQEILLRTGKQVNPTDSDWITRVGGIRGAPAIKHHHQYGGGLVDAVAATNLAKTWTTLEPMASMTTNYSGTLSIPDNNATGASTTFDLNNAPLMRVEHVELTVSITHPRRGDLEILLVSPNGTVSQLATQSTADDGAISWPSLSTLPASVRGYDNWTFSSVRHWGEMAKGVWSIIVKDRLSGATGSLTSASLKIYGSNVQPASIASAPDNQVVILGQPVTFTMTAGGSYDINYAWRKGTTTITGATSSSYTIPAVALTDAGSYTVEASNVSGSASAEVLLGVVAPAPTSVTGNIDRRLTLTVQAAGDVTYQWKRDGVVLTDTDTVVGTQTATLALDPLAANQDSSVAGKYECVVSIGNVTRSAGLTTVKVRQPPSLLTPPSDKAIILGQNTTLTAVGTGSDEISYQWTYNGVDIPGATSASYTITNAKATDAGSYGVRVFNAAGSNSATVSVAVVTPSSPNVTANVGQPFVLTAQASGPGLTYQWMRGGVPIVNGGGITGANSATLTINPLTTADDSTSKGNYECIITAGTATLSTGPTAVKVRRPPTVQTPPGDQVLFVGQVGALNVVAGGSDEIAYQWKKTGVDIPGATTSTLSFSSVKLTDAGNYGISVFNASGSNNATSNVAVVQPPPTTAVANIGKKLTLTVQAAGTSITYQWTRNGVPMANGNGVTGANTNTLNIEPITEGDAATYECVVTIGSASRGTGGTAVSVRQPPTLVLSPVPDLAVMVGQPINLTSSATSSFEINYQWKRNGVAIPGATSANLTIASAKLTDGGLYTIEVSNAAGANTSDARVTVIQTATPPTTTVNTGGRLVLTVNAQGPNVTYQWTRGGVPLVDDGRITGAKTNQLIIDPTNENDDSSKTGPYECIITVGNVSQPAGPMAVAVRVPPTLTLSPPKDVIVMLGQPINLTSSASSSFEINYQWKLNGTAIAGATSANLSIASAKLTDGGTYTIEVSNAAGVNKADARVTVLTPATPPTTTVNVGGRLVFTVTAQGPNVTYQWTRGGIPLVNDGRITGAQTNTLVIDPATAADDSSVVGPYQCIITSGTVSQPAGPMVGNVRVPPILTVKPTSDAIVMVGQPISLTSTATSAFEINYQWKRNNANITGATAANFSIPTAKLTDGATYTIEVSNAAGANKSDSRVVVVQPSAPTASIALGKKLVLTVSAQGPGITYQWTRGGIALADDTRIVGSKTNQLCLVTTLAEDDTTTAGAYACIVTVGTVSRSAGDITTSILLPPNISISSTTIPGMAVSAPAEILMDPNNGATSYIIKNLPSGLTYDPKTGRIYGIPNVPVVDWPVYITACNANGCSTVTIRINIDPLDPNLIGLYNGLVERNASATANSTYGGLVSNFALSATGTYSGRIVMAEKTYPFSGRIVNNLEGNPDGTVSITRPGLPAMTLTFHLERSNGHMTGSLKEGTKWTAGCEAWRNKYDASHPATEVMGWHNFWLEVPPGVLPGSTPQGAPTGWTSTNNLGQITFTTRLPESLAIVTLATTIGREGDIPYHQMCFSNKGSMNGWFKIENKDYPEPNILSGQMSWNKTGPSSASDRFYAAGFDLGVNNANAMNIVGSEHIVPAVGQMISTIPYAASNQANGVFTFFGGEIELSDGIVNLNSSFRVGTVTSMKLPIPLSYPFGNPAGFSWQIHPANGTFYGTGNVKDGKITRQIKFYGFLASAHNRGGGFFVIPSIPVSPYTTSNSPMRVGTVSLEPLNP